jgi:protein-S-isoprenylcysteine O-methyltransferase Ste14
LKGLRKFIEKLPGLQGKKIVLLPLAAGLSFVAGLLFLLALDTIPRLYPANDFLRDAECLLPVLGPMISATAGWMTVFMMWYRKERYLAANKERAYQRGIFLGMLGIPLIFATVTHAYFPIERLFGVLPVDSRTIALSSPLITFPGTLNALNWVITVPGSLFLLLTGLLTCLRSLLTFGIDYMGLVYLYYPEESEVQDHGIYSAVRHPAYMGLLMIAFGGVLARLSAYSLVNFLILVIGFICHIRLVEEPELIQRFGPSFVKYRRQVPALHVKPTKLVHYCRFLLGK